MKVAELISRWFALRPEFSEGQVLCLNAAGYHRMAYTEWGDPENPEVVVCAHGLTRNGRDFDFLARALAGRFRVICPDVVGRGRSDWLPDKSGYGLAQYAADMVVLLARLQVDSVHWVGTSMGGLIGMVLASHAGAPIRRLVLNDVGPSISAESLRRIGEYVGKAPRFPSVDDAEKYVRFVSAPFGQLTDAQWRHLTETGLRRADDGQWELRYDPGIGEPFRQTMLLQNVDLWPIYERIACPVLLVRGADSDLLTAETAAAMAVRGPRARLVEIAGVGHAPMFLDAAQVAPVVDFLSAD